MEKTIQFLLKASRIFLITIVLMLFVELLSYLLFHYSLYKQQHSNGLSSHGLIKLGEEQKNYLKEQPATETIPYKSNVGWQSTEFHGKFININSEGLRITGYENRNPGGRTVHFFGSSTMRGYGVADDGTIPVIIGGTTSFNTINYAELGWNSRQSVNRLFEYMNSIKPNDIIVFYDGGADAIYSCKAGLVGTNARESQINAALDAVSYGDRSYKSGINIFIRNTYTFDVFKRLFKKAAAVVYPVSSSCENSEMANAVADFLLRSWEIAEYIARMRGARLACILPPTPYTSSASSDKDSAFPVSDISLSLRAVYPLIKKKAANLPCFVDFSDVLENDMFFDNYGHLTREGNKKIVDFLTPKILEEER